MSDEFSFHPDLRVNEKTIGTEKAPLLVIDQLISEPDRLVEQAKEADYEPPTQMFPGVRAVAPKAYQRFLLRRLGPQLIEYFNLRCRGLRFSMCHYSLVSKQPEELGLLQRIPHVDSFGSDGLATVHYLFRQPLGGTDFYRHRQTGFEIIDESRKQAYFRSLEAENGGPNMPAPGYIYGDTPLFERIGGEEGIFNRILIYRRNSLHSGSIAPSFVPDPDPRSGRLSINSFIDPTY